MMDAQSAFTHFLRIGWDSREFGLYGLWSLDYAVRSVVKAALEMMGEVCSVSDSVYCTLRLIITVITCVDQLSLRDEQNITWF